MKFRFFPFACSLALGTALLGCNEKDKTDCAHLVYNGAARGAAPLVPAPNPNAINVSDQPVLHFALKQSDRHAPDHQTHGTPVFTVELSPSGSGQYTLRTVHIDVQNLDPDATELQIAWNKDTVVSYQLISFETRVPPSSKPGVSLDIDVVEVAQDTGPTTLGTVSAWGEKDATPVQLGTSQSVDDPYPFHFYPIDTPYLPPQCQTL